MGTLLLEYFNSIVCPTNINRLRFDETAWQTCHRQCGCSLISRWSRGDRGPWPARRPSHDRTVLDLADPHCRSCLLSSPCKRLFGLCPYIYIHECHRTIELLWDRHADSVVACIVVLSSFAIRFLVDRRCCRCCLCYVTVPWFRCISFSDRFRSTSSPSHKRKRREKERFETSPWESRENGIREDRIQDTIGWRIFS